MIKASLNKIRQIEQGKNIDFIVKIHWQVPEIYSADNKLIRVGDITTSISDNVYEVANTTIELSNEDYYFSRRLEKELPNGKLVEIYIYDDILLLRAIVDGWELTQTTLRLNINA